MADPKTVLDLLPNSSISVAYHSDFGPHDDLLLLELDEKLIPDVLFERVSLRGEPDEEAVLCTESKTYAIKFVGTSNSVFLIPPSNFLSFSQDAMDCDEQALDQPGLASVLKVASGSLELVEVAPRLDKLKQILLENPFSIQELSEMATFSETQENNFLYRWDDLIQKIQASDKELRLGLDALGAFEIDGYWRIVDDKCMDSVLNMLLQNAVLNDWSFDAIPEDQMVTVLQSDGFLPKISVHCLKLYGTKVGSDDASLWKLNNKRVCVHFAKEILRNGKMKMEKFLEEWKSKIPHGMEINFDMLEGEVLTERIGVENWIRAFSVSSLPSTPAARFSILFKERPKWEWKDLEPYIRDLKVPGLSSEGLLLKYTRRSQPRPEVEPIFSARIPVHNWCPLTAVLISPAELLSKMDPYSHGNSGKELQPEEREHHPGTLRAVGREVREYSCFNKYDFENHYMYMRRIEELRDWANIAASNLRRQWEEIVERRTRPVDCSCGGRTRTPGHYHLSPNTPCSNLPSYLFPSADQPSSSRQPPPNRRLNFDYMTPQPAVREPTPLPPVQPAQMPEPEPAPVQDPVAEPFEEEAEESDSDILMWEEIPPSPEIIYISSDEEEPMEEEEEPEEMDDDLDPDFDLDNYDEHSDSQDGQLP